MKADRLLAVVDKEAHEILRDPITVWVSLLLPLVMLFLFGYAISLDVDDVALGVLDQDQSPVSRTLTDRFVQSGYFRLTAAFDSHQEVETALQKGKVRLAMVIPPRFHADLARGEQPAVQLLVDGTHWSGRSAGRSPSPSILTGNSGMPPRRRCLSSYTDDHAEFTSAKARNS